MNLTEKVIKGSSTLLLLRVFIRVAGIISMLTLARLLDTDDFGIVAIATSAVFLFDILSESGTSHYIIQKTNIDDDDLNTSWSLNILLKLVVWVIFIVCVPFISDYFEEPKLIMALYAISLILPISAFYNPAMWLYQKELNFKPDFKLAVIDKTISFFTVISLALIFRSYWAMIVGVVLPYITKNILSYRLHPYRPSWSLNKLHEQWQFSKWVLFKGVLGYVRAEFDTFIVTKQFGMSAIGGYNMMKGLSAIPAQDIIVPATQPLLSSFAKVKSDPKSLKYQISLSLLIICLTIFPVATYVGLNHALITSVILGDKWIEYSEILGVMSIFIFTFSFISIFHYALIAVNKVKVIFYYDFITVVLLITILSISNLNDLLEFTIYRCALALISVFIFTIVVMKIFKLAALHIIKLILPIILVCAMSSYSSYYFDLLFTNSLFTLVLSCIFFFGNYLILISIFSLLYKNTEEVNHIKSLLHNGLNLAFKKMKKTT